MYGRYRSGSVGRGEVGSSSSQGASSYRSNYGTTSTTTPSSTSRFSRASSYDPFSASSSSYQRPSRFDSGGSGAMSGYGSCSYRAGGSTTSHNDYAPKPYSTRFGSTDRLSSLPSSSSLSSSLSHRPPAYPSSSLMSRSYGTPVGTSSYSRASVSRETPSRTTTSYSSGPREYGGVSSYRSGGSSTGYSGGYGGGATSSSYSSRPPYTSPSYSSTSTSAYTPRTRFEFRSKTPGYSSEYSSSSASVRRDRDYRSVSRFERATPTRETSQRERKNSDEVERTFQTLYNRYVRDASSSSLSSVEETAPVKKISITMPRKFISHSEAEEETEEEDSPEEIDFGLLRGRSGLTATDDLTPMCSPTKELTPIVNASRSITTTPTPAPKAEDTVVKPKEDASIKASDRFNAISSIAEQAAEKAREKAVEAEKQKSSSEHSVESFKEKFSDVNMQPVVIAKRDLKPASSQMDRLLKNEKTIDAIEKISVSRDSTPKAATPSPTAAASKPAAPIVASPSRSTTPAAAATPSKPAATATTAAAKVPSSPILKTSVSAIKTTITTREASPKPPTIAKKEPSPAPKSTVTKEPSPAPKPAVSATVTPAAPKPTVTKKESSPAPAAKVLTKEASPAPIPSTVTTKATVTKEPSPLPKSTVVKEPTPAPKDTVSKEESSPAPKTKDQPAPRRRETSRSREPSVGVTIVLGGGAPEDKGTSVDKLKREASVVREGSPSLLAPPAPRGVRRSSEEAGSKKMDSPPEASAIPRRRDRSGRTLDALKARLDERKKSDDSEESVKGEDSPRANKPPMLLVTQPSLPNTPRASSSGGYQWEDARSDGTDDDEMEDEEDSDTEFCVSETFRFEQPRVQLGILDGVRSTKSPFSDFDSDIDMSMFLASSASGRRESRGRVGAHAAQPAPPPPVFTASITFDGQEDVWDSAREEDDDEYRPGSSAMGVYLSPAEFSSDESFDGEHFHDSVQVGCTLTLCQKAALRDGDDETDSEFYESEEYSDESWYEDEDEDEEEYGSEYVDEEEEEEEECEDEDEELSAWSGEEDEPPAPRFLPVDADVSVDTVEYEEVDGEMGLSATLSLSKATVKRTLKDGQSERPDISVVAQSVVPCEEESFSGEEVGEWNEKLVEPTSATMIQSSPIARKREIHVVPTYVKAQEEKVNAEETSRFAADSKKATDFAKKSVIQPPKLAKAEVQQVETKIGAERPKVSEEPKKDAAAAKPPIAAAAASAAAASKASPAAAVTAPVATPAAAAVAAVKKPELEDKSAARKSALNMTAEEAKKKEKEEKEAAQSKARRFGTVTSLADKFKEEPPKEDYSYKRSSRLTQRDEERPRKKYEMVKPVLNDDFDKQVAELRNKMKSGTTNLQSQMIELNKGILSKTEEAKLKELEEKHKSLLDKTSGVFGKADEEKERWKKTRDAETEKDLIRIEEGKRKGRSPQPEEKKMDELKPAAEPKRTVRKINRDKSPTPAPAAAAAASTPTPATKVAAAAAKPGAATAATTTPTIGKPGVVPAVPPAPPAAAAAKSAATPAAAAAAGKVPEPPKPPPAAPAAKKDEEKKLTPKPLRKMMNTQPAAMQSGPKKLPDAKIEVNDNNADLFEAVAFVATKRKKSITELRNAKEEAKKERLAALREGKTIKEIQGPKGDGAAATKIRNAQAKADDISQASSDRSGNKRYSARRKTQELVNPSALSCEPKPKRRRRVTRRRYTRDPHDIDIILGWDKENTFEQLERKFAAASSDKMKQSMNGERRAMRKRRRPMNTKIWISELTDIDKIYKTSELRDIQASVG